MSLKMYCRLCALEHSHIIPILEAEIAQKLLNILSLEVSLTDDLPKSICMKCLSLVNKFNDFKTNVLKAQKYLELLVLEFDNNIDVNDTIEEITVNIKPEVSEIISETRNDNKVSPTKQIICQQQDETSLRVNYNQISNDKNDVETGSNMIKSNGSKKVKVEDYYGCYEIQNSESYNLLNSITTDTAEIINNSNLLNNRQQAVSNNKSKKFIEWECNECGDLKNSWKELGKHFRKVHKTKTKVYKCRYCSELFRNFVYLYRHINFHNKDNIVTQLNNKKQPTREELSLRLNNNNYYTTEGARRRYLLRPIKRLDGKY